MKHVAVFAALLMIVSTPCLVENTMPAEYRLVWADEFDVAGKPDPRNWAFEQGFVRNQELQWYQSENAFCANGKLIIEGRRERRPNPNYKQGSGN